MYARTTITYIPWVHFLFPLFIRLSFGGGKKKTLTGMWIRSCLPGLAGSLNEENFTVTHVVGNIPCTCILIYSVHIYYAYLLIGLQAFMVKIIVGLGIGMGLLMESFSSANPLATRLAKLQGEEFSSKIFCFSFPEIILPSRRNQ